MRTTEQLVELLTRHGVELVGNTPEAKVSRWLRPLGWIPDPSVPNHAVYKYEHGDGLGVQVSARYDWDRGVFVVRDWWTYNA